MQARFTKLEALTDFLVQAKRSTYASLGDEASVTPLLAGSKQLEYRRGEFFYRDIYAGMSYFAGQEIVYCTHAPIWSMSYAGGVEPEITAGRLRQVYSFLRQALLQVPPAFPVRGPELFQTAGWRYTNEYFGTIEGFHGREAIVEGAVPMYELRYAGGCLA